MGENDQSQRLRDSLVALDADESRLRRWIDPPIGTQAEARQSRAMSLNLQNEAALRLQRGGTRRGMLASALFGRSCRMLDLPANRDRVSAVPRPEQQTRARD